MSQTSDSEATERGIRAGRQNPNREEAQRDSDRDDEESFENKVVIIKARRRQLRGRITRTINRVRAAMERQEITVRRLQREMVELSTDFSTTSDLHSELYDFVSGSEHSKMDQWEAQLTDDRFAIEEEVEDYIAKCKLNQTADGVVHRGLKQSLDSNGEKVTPRTVPSVKLRSQVSESTLDQSVSACPGQGDIRLSGPSTETCSIPLVSAERKREQLDSSFDAWIDDLVEFRETELEVSSREMSVADALYRLEASKDIPSLKLAKFDGNPLLYVEFIETFKIHVHDKHHLNDDMRMVQLKMHITGEAERSVSGLGCGGIMYATALKMIKEQFGQRSAIARAFITKLTKGPKIANNNRQGLRDMSHDIVNCIAILQRLSFFAYANTVDSLRLVVSRLPDYLINRWRDVVTEIRERGELPTLEHVSVFLRKRVKSAFDPDFGVLDADKFECRNYPSKDRRRGVHVTQNTLGPSKKPLRCFVCGEEHKVSDCPTYNDSSVKERIQLIKENRLCFGCLLKGHVTRECRSKKPCGKNNCVKTHHPSLHTDPPSASGATLRLDKDGILPVLRANFRSANGHIRQGNVLIDTGAATTIIRKDFARQLGLQGRRESLHISVVGGEELSERDSRHVKFWISSITGGEEFEVEAHEISKTVVSVPPLDRVWLSSFHHLRDISFSHKAGPIDLILGVQYSHLHAEDEIRQGRQFEPVAKRTKLGWFVIGPDNKSTSAISSVNFVEKIDMNAFYAMETLGVQAQTCHCSSNDVITPDERKAMDMFETSCHKEGDRYVIGLPWRKDPCLLPNNYSLAEKRLVALERSLLKNPTKCGMYREAIEQYKTNGWAMKLTGEELTKGVKPVYYLPHHAIYRPDKPSTPLRIVFDPASQFGGVSLNSFLLKGPNLIGDLLGVLIRFRET